jgi:hypothetical protein
MRLNELALMSNPVRALVQRHVEVPRLLRLGGRMTGGRALEIGCGRGAGTGLSGSLTQDSEQVAGAIAWFVATKGA